MQDRNQWGILWRKKIIIVLIIFITFSNEVYVALGSVYRSAQGAQILRTERLIIHGTYLKTGRNDIGLLKLKTAAQLSRYLSNLLFQ